MSEKSLQQKTQERFVILASLAVIVVSVLTTLYVSGALSGFSPEADEGYNNITFTDAVITCQDQTRDQYRHALRNLTLDDHSSRFEQSSNTYKIFFNARMASQKSESGESEFFVNCYVSGARGRISSFEAYENKESATEVIRKNNGGLFGWPLNK